MFVFRRFYLSFSFKTEIYSVSFLLQIETKGKNQNRIYPKTWKSGTQSFCCFIFHNFDTKKKTKGEEEVGETERDKQNRFTRTLKWCIKAMSKCGFVCSPTWIYCTTCCGFNVNVVFHTQNSWCLTLCASTTYEKRTQMGIKPNWECAATTIVSQHTICVSFRAFETIEVDIVVDTCPGSSAAERTIEKRRENICVCGTVWTGSVSR